MRQASDHRGQTRCDAGEDPLPHGTPRAREGAVPSPSSLAGSRTRAPGGRTDGNPRPRIPNRTPLAAVANHALAAGLADGIAALGAAMDGTGPDPDRYALLRALAASASGELPMALASAHRAARADPNDGVRLSVLATLLARLGHGDWASRLARRAADLDPARRETQETLLRLARHSDPASAARAIEDMAVLLPADAGDRLASLAEGLGLAALAALRVENGRIKGWVWRRDGERSIVVHAEGAAGSRRIHVRAEAGDTADRPEAPRTVDLPWPGGAERVRLHWGDGIAVPADPLLPPPAPVRTPPARGDASEGGSGGVRRPARSADPAAAPVTVVVPVHGGAETVSRCIAALSAGRAARAYEILAIDDASPDRETRALLDDRAARGEIRLLKNACNLGFTATANRGLGEARGDAVLLNADALVPRGWLDRLAGHAGRDPSVGTVTPLTNNGQIVNLLGLAAPVPLPDMASLERLDAAAARVNAGRAADLPTGVGFCLYIRRGCLDETGLLDASVFGRGYGEETDFCLRAAARGWRHVCALDVVVGHHGGASFGPEKAGLVRRNMARIAGRHPTYPALMARFRAAHPLVEGLARLRGAAGSDWPEAPRSRPEPPAAAPRQSVPGNPARIAVLHGVRAPAGAARLRALALAAADRHFFLLEASPIDRALERTGRASPLGDVDPYRRGEIAAALGCGRGLVLVPPGAPAPFDAEPGLAAGIGDALTIIGGPTLGLPPLARHVPWDASPAAALAALACEAPCPA